MSLLSSSNSSAYLRSRRLLTDFDGVATQDSRRVTMEAAAQARLRQLVRLNAMLLLNRVVWCGWRLD